jgi:3-hydroxybutyryl-CoA dehydratase
VIDLDLGDRAQMSRTITETDIVLFAGITGDTNPAHLDEEYAKGTRFGGRLAHGMLSAGLVSAVLGTKLPGPGTIYLEQSLRFVAPVRPGDTVTAEVVVAEMLPKGRVRLSTTCTNQQGARVLEGEALVLAPRAG